MLYNIQKKNEHTTKNLVFFMTYQANEEGLMFLVLKGEVDEPHLTKKELDEFVEKRIVEECERVKNDSISIQRAKNDVCKLTRRGMPNKVKDYLAYVGSSELDAGIIALEHNGKYSVYFQDNWKDYYKVIEQ